MEVTTVQENKHRILVINPGSTSTKIGVFDNDRSVFEKTIRHETESINQFPKIRFFKLLTKKELTFQS